MWLCFVVRVSISVNCILMYFFLNDCVYLLEEEQQESEFWRKNKIKSNGEGNAYLFPAQNP